MSEKLAAAEELVEETTETPVKKAKTVAKKKTAKINIKTYK